MEQFNSQNISVAQERFLSCLEEGSLEYGLIERINNSLLKPEATAKWYFFYHKLHQEASGAMQQTCDNEKSRWLCNNYYPAVSRFYWVMEDFYLDQGYRALHAEHRLKDGNVDLAVEQNFSKLILKVYYEQADSDWPTPEFCLDEQILLKAIFDSKQRRDNMADEYRKRLDGIDKLCDAELKKLPNQVSIVYQTPLHALASAYQSVVFSVEFGQFMLTKK